MVNVKPTYSKGGYMSIWVLAIAIRMGAEIERRDVPFKTKAECETAKSKVEYNIKNSTKIPAGVQLVAAHCSEKRR